MLARGESPSIWRFFHINVTFVCSFYAKKGRMVHPVNNVETAQTTVTRFENTVASLIKRLALPNDIRWRLADPEQVSRAHAPQWMFSQAGNFTVAIEDDYGREITLHMLENAYVNFSALPAPTSAFDTAYREWGAATAMKIGAYQGFYDVLAKQPQYKEEPQLACMGADLKLCCQTAEHQLRAHTKTTGKDYMPFSLSDFKQIRDYARKEYVAQLTSYFTTQKQR